MTNLSARSDTESEPPAPRSELVFLSALCLLCFFWRLGSAGLFDFNEGLYAQAAREMVLRGDWVAGSVNGVLFFDKPPLALWLTAISYSTFGFTEFAARLPVALAATGLVFLTYWFGARHFSRKAGVLAGAVLALGPLFLGTARQMTMDIHQSLWFAVAMVSFFEGYRAESAAGKRWYYVFWIGCGLAFMAKSVPGLFPVAACLAFVVIQARFRPRDIAMRVWEAKPLAGLLILVLIIAPWHYAAYQKHGDYFYQEYWVLHHVALLKGTDFDHAQPFWYYFPALFAGMFPWSVFLIPALVFAWKQARSTTIADSESTARRFVLVWSLVVFLVFSAMTSKLVSYLLPMYSAAAVLIGDWLDRVIAGQRNTRGFTISAGLAAALAAIVTVGAAAALYHYTRPGVDVRGDFAPAAGAWIIPAVLAVAVGAAAAAVLSLRQSPRRAVAAMAMGSILFAALAVEVGLGMLDREINLPLRRLAGEAGKLTANGAPLAIHIAGPRRPSVYFYLPDRIFGQPMVERGEIEPLREFLRERRPAYVLADKERAERLMAAAPDLHVRGHSGKWVLLHAAAAASTRHPLVSPPSP